MNKLYYGDNLDILREHIKDESVDLIYLDPPFKSGQNYNVLFEEKNGSKSVAQIQAFEDTWQWDRKAAETYQEILETAPGKTCNLIIAFEKALGHNDMFAYLVMMAIRILELRRALKPTGSLYLHCDPTASHYLKLILDAVFGYKNFNNEVIWFYKSGGATKKRWSRKHDTIFYYSKTNKYIFNPQTEKSYNRDLKPYRFKGVKEYKDDVGWYTLVNMKDVWNIDMVGRTSRERLGYPTQKPETLLERIIKASSNSDGIIMDPFCGCGTTITVAEKLKRQWIGIDVTHLAISLIKYRLADTFEYTVEYEVHGEPKDVAGAQFLAKQDPFQFESWALGLVKAKPTQKTADRGIDGNIYFQDDPKGGPPAQIVVSVKSGTINPGVLRDLKGTVEREKAAIGILITLNEPTRGMNKEALDAGKYTSPFGKKYDKIQILTIKELFEGKQIERPRERIHSYDVTFKKPKKHKGGWVKQPDVFDKPENEDDPT
ncbi:MAG: DNA methyltransferase [bacterium]